MKLLILFSTYEWKFLYAITGVILMCFKELTKYPSVFIQFENPCFSIYFHSCRMAMCSVYLLCFYSVKIVVIR